MNMWNYLVVLFNLFYLINGVFHTDPGPWFNSTKGEPWPKPAARTLYSEFSLIKPSSFSISVNLVNCDILEEAKQRYREIIITEARIGRKLVKNINDRLDRNHPFFNGTLSELDINVQGSCEKMPYLNMNEKYELEVSGSKARLNASTVWGALRGLETFSQLLIPSGAKLAVKNQKIVDEPKLPHRGLLLDTSRHFFPVSDILLTLDAMSYNKFNVFHWHIIDDNSFPYKSLEFPELSDKGAYHPSMIYTPSQIKSIIEYARLRGIRVIAELDSPGHVASWGLSHPEFLTTCYDKDGKKNGKLGPLNPINPAIWPFMNKFLKEAMRLFTDDFIHLGGDEVPFDCWESNPEIIAYMKEHEMGDNFAGLESNYIKELLKIPSSNNKSSIVWQEVFDNGVEVTPDTVIHVWIGDAADKMSKVTKAGLRVLLSACWYLDHVAGGGDWEKFYLCDPLDFDGSERVKDLMLGGEACMWSEFVDRNNMHSRVWPRASAAAEQLWSWSVDPLNRASERLQEHSCRMKRRDIPAQPANGPDFCIL